MNKQPLEHNRLTLDPTVESVGVRDQAAVSERGPSGNRTSDWNQRHADNGNDLVAKLDRLIEALPAIASSPTLEQMTREIERIENDALGTLAERLSASLQTAMSVQLAPLSDNLPDRLADIVAASVEKSSAASAFTMPDLIRELEKFETRSMASLAARMTAGLQTTIATQLASLTTELPQTIAAAVAAALPGAAALPMKRASSPFSDPEPNDPSIELAGELQRVRSELAETEALLAEALEHDTRSSSQVAASADMAARLSAMEIDRDRLQLALDENRVELSRVRSEAASSDSDQEQHRVLVDVLRSEVIELRGLLAAKEYDCAQLEELRAELARLRENAAMGVALDPVNNSADEEELRDRLDRATCEIVDLRTQNEDLAEQVARLQVSTAPHGPMPHLGHEGMSWEERKRLLLQQLDAEQDESTPQSQTKRIEINDVLRTTEAELARRDREIAELRSLVQQQSDARQGMAVGAAAVAQLIESDELVQQEREKLRAIQKSWDEKLRQAEIDLSMERAKLARERLQLEEQKHKLEEALQSASAAAEADAGGKPADVKGRKWLSRLGLKEEG